MCATFVVPSTQRAPLRVGAISITSNTCAHRPAVRLAPLARHSAPSAPPQVRALVHKLLSLTASCDGGVSLSKAQRRAVERTIATLRQMGSYRANALLDKRLFANYSLLYATPRGGAPAAGGVFRSGFARLFLRNNGLFQHIVSPDVVVNVVCVRLLAVLPMCVALRGCLTRVEDDSDEVCVQFERPRLSVLGCVFEFGGESSVRLRTPFLDDGVRLGIGSRGSAFVFASDEHAESARAQQWKHMYECKPFSVWWLLALAIVSMIILYFILTSITTTM